MADNNMGICKFFQTIPKDDHYYLELRTDLYLRDQVFEVLERYGVGQVLSHWTWLVEGMLQPEMVRETVEILKTAIEKGVLVNLIINNRAGGNAPLIAEEIAEKFLGKSQPTLKGQLGLW